MTDSIIYVPEIKENSDKKRKSFGPTFNDKNIDYSMFCLFSNYYGENNKKREIPKCMMTDPSIQLTGD